MIYYLSISYQFWKKKSFFAFLLFFQKRLWIESSTFVLFEIIFEISCNIINVFTVTFEQLNASLLEWMNEWKK